MRYVPKRRMKFDYQGGDGPMCLIFDAGDPSKYTSAKHTWKVAALSAAPAAYYANLTLAAQFWYVYPMMFLPTAYYMKAAMRVNRLLKTTVCKMWVLKNGD
jgi:hypothetical protein